MANEFTPKANDLSSSLTILIIKILDWLIDNYKNTWLIDNCKNTWVIDNYNNNWLIDNYKNSWIIDNYKKYLIDW